jgi:HNH endonuclease
LAAETARRLACDAAIVPLIERGGKPLSVGRRTRAVPAALRRALASRDRGCRFPGCTNRCSVDAHHVRHWAHGGPTSLDNLVQVCRYHHRLLHEGGYSVEASGAGFLFRRPDGRQLHSVPTPPPGRAGALRALARSVHPEACVPKSGGEPMDLVLCVDAMLSAAPTEAPGI